MGKAWLAAGVACVGVLSAFQNFQKPFREYPAFEYNTFPIPPDYQEKTEFVFARLMYPDASFGGGFGGFGRRGRFGNWREGRSFWTMDYPRSDRHLMLALKRLTRVHARSVEQAINMEEHDQFDWPWMYGVEVGHWDLGGELAQQLREYLLRGGFLMVDDFHGSEEWAIFMHSMEQVFPDRQVVELPNDNQIFHIIHDLDDRYQVPGTAAWDRGVTYEKGGIEAHWRGIFDDHGRVMVAICHNMDLGDSWEHADDPDYPQKFSALGIRIAVNYVAYAMTH
jgi:hypothetical protein